MKVLVVWVAVLLFSACASTPEKPAPAPAPQPQPSASRPSAEESDFEVDVEGLKRSLGLDGPAEDLGYKERAFNTCQVGFGYSSSRYCQRKIMAVVRFRLQCRDSVGTISSALGASDLEAIAGKKVRWTFAKVEGTDQTDGQGFAEAQGIFPTSPKKEWLRIAVGSQFLHMRAGDVSRIVVPRPWCDQ